MNYDVPIVQLCPMIYGGVLPQTYECLMQDLLHLGKHVPLRHGTVYNDADIGRCRGKVASAFYQSWHQMGDKRRRPDVCVMIDHDLTWRTGRFEDGYECMSDLLHMVMAAHQTKGIVGGIVSLRTFGGGIASRFARTGEFRTGEDRIEPATYVGSAFMAFHRDVLDRMIRAGSVKLNHDNWWPFFLQEQREHPEMPGAQEHLSEDWAFCRRALDLDIPVHIDCYPVIHHHGHYGFGIQDAFTQWPPKQQVQDAA